MTATRLMVREDSRETGFVRAEAADEVEVIRLAGQAAGGDTGAFGELYGLYLDRIYRYVFYQVRNRMLAEDLTEEIFMKAWQSIRSFKGKGRRFSAWLYRIAHNHVIDNFRSQRTNLSVELDSIAETMAADGDCPEEEAEKRFAQEQVLRLISALPPQQKHIIILKFIEGLDNIEIEEITGQSQGAIRMAQMRSLAALRQKLGTGEEKCLQKCQSL